MFDVNTYLTDGKVERSKIALDIKYRTIGRTELDVLISDPRIQAAFFGDGYKDKKPRSAWTQDYLDQLSYAAVATAFNPEYLYYLNEVADSAAAEPRPSNPILGAVRSIAAAVKRHPLVSVLLLVAAVIVLVLAFTSIMNQPR